MLGPKSHYYVDIISTTRATHPSIHVLIQPTNIYWALSFVLGTVLDAGDIAGGETYTVLAFMELTFWWQNTDNTGKPLGLWAFLTLTFYHEFLLPEHSFIHSIHSSVNIYCWAKQIQFALCEFAFSKGLLSISTSVYFLGICSEFSMGLQRSGACSLIPHPFLL